MTRPQSNHWFLAATFNITKLLGLILSVTFSSCRDSSLIYPIFLILLRQPRFTFCLISDLIWIVSGLLSCKLEKPLRLKFSLHHPRLWFFRVSEKCFSVWFGFAICSLSLSLSLSLWVWVVACVCVVPVPFSYPENNQRAYLKGHCVTEIHFWKFVIWSDLQIWSIIKTPN